MINPLRSYSSTTDSGVACLGRVPTHWEVRRLGQIGELSKGRGGNKADEVSTGTPCVRYGDLYTCHEFFIHASRSAIPERATANYTRIRFGDVLFAGSGETIDEIGKSAVCLMRSEARCGGDIIRFRSRGPVDARYLGYATGCRSAVLQKAAMGRGITVMHVYAAQLKRLALPIPPLSEQAAIAHFLDHVDGRIRRYIRAKEKLIALLEEQKQAVIHQAVTGQIDVRTGQSYPVYKDSGVEWLGEAPVHWDIVPLRRVTLDRCDGPFGSGLKSSHYRDYGVRVVRLQNIGHGKFRDSNAAFISARHSATLGDHSVLPNDLLVAGLGDRNHPAGRACVAPGGLGPAMVKADCFRFRLNEGRIGPRFAALQLTATAAAATALLSTGSTRQRINLQSTGARAVSVPPLREQAHIVKHVDIRVAGIRRSQQAATRQAEFASEYRTRLIADLVTGKLDVREAAGSLPEVDPLEIETDREESGGARSAVAGELADVDDVSRSADA